MTVSTAGMTLILGMNVLGAPVAQAAHENETPRSVLPGPGAVLTFDDHTVGHWVAAIPLFAKYGAHATFFIDHWDRLTPEQVRGLRTLRAAGHAIGCHGLRHRRAVDYYRKFSMAKYLADEITPAVDLMHRAGFFPVSFAYPCSQHDGKTDTAMLGGGPGKTPGIFRHLRSGCGRGKGESLARVKYIFTPIDQVSARGCLIGTCVQPHTADAPILKEVKEAFERAKTQDEIIVFYAHDIRPADQPGPTNFISPDALEIELRAARDAGLRFYTFNDLP